MVDEDDDDPLISLDRLRVADTTVELARREVTLGSLELSKANISCRREKDGYAEPGQGLCSRQPEPRS